MQKLGEPWDTISAALPYAILALWLAFAAALLAGCVTRVQVCASYDRRLGRERAAAGEQARNNAGASVCADLERQ